VNLLATLLEYDPRARISAADALAHPAFGRLRDADEQWQTTAQILPFPVFFGPNHFAEPAYRPPGPAALEQQRAQEEVALPPLANRPAPAAIANLSLQESRFKAAQRIREYKKKKVGNLQPKGNGKPEIIRPKLPRL
jgi:serine/threonine protein kinase